MSSFGEDQGFDLIADGHDLIGVDVVLDGELAGRDDAFGLVADVEQDFVAVNLDDGPFDDVAIVEVLDGLVDGGEKVLARADVVDGYLRRGDGGTWHVVGLLRTGWIVGTVVIASADVYPQQRSQHHRRVPVEVTRLGTRWTNSVPMPAHRSQLPCYWCHYAGRAAAAAPTSSCRRMTSACYSGESARSGRRWACSSRWAPSPG